MDNRNPNRYQNGARPAPDGRRPAQGTPQRQPQGRPMPGGQGGGRGVPRQGDGRRQQGYTSGRAAAPSGAYPGRTPEAERRARQRQMNTRAASSVRRKATREQMREENRRRRRRAGRMLLSRFVTYLVMLLLVGGVCAGVFFLKFYKAPDAGENNVTYFESYNGGKTTKTSVSGDVVYRSGVLYVNFSSIAEGCSMTSITDKNTAKFVLPDGTNTDSDGSGKEEYVVFTKDSTECEISGQPWRLSSPSCFVSKNVWIPADFVTDYMTGIEITEDRAKGNVTVKRLTDISAVGDSGESVMMPVSFNLKSTTPPETQDVGTDANAAAASAMPEVTFTSDLSAYENYMDPVDNAEYLVLVNKTTKVDASLVPNDLTDVADTRKDGRATQRMREYAEKSLEAMFIEMRSAGYTDVSVTSAYRSYEYQEQLYNSYTDTEMSRDSTLTREQAQAIVSTYSARPGESEHQTGLSCDLHNLSQASTEFKDQPVYGWLSENAWKFGFILRFPEDKTEITGYSFEPWHYRFVGRRVAWQIKNAGQCLEEYLAN